MISAGGLQRQRSKCKIRNRIDAVGNHLDRSALLEANRRQIAHPPHRETKHLSGRQLPLHRHHQDIAVHLNLAHRILFIALMERDHLAPDQPLSGLGVDHLIEVNPGLRRLLAAARNQRPGRLIIELPNAG